MAQLMAPRGGATPQDKKHTKVELQNNSKHDVSLISRQVWEGDRHTNFPRKITDDDDAEFTQSAGLSEGSVAGLAYKILDDGKKWVVTWSNPRCEDSKVYTAIVDGKIDWNQIKKELDNRGRSNYEAVRFGYRATIAVDNIKTRSPTVNVYIEPQA
ncbi:uncharacterized protein LOC120180742 [Hibiscus syriacus]|uniref:uncharacterized protein LOC120180742 n=1 Tax=Hibiscus syriacus TaxID=106335 RepID=UPI001922BA1B|nr:uncharacterized protein LOC120180742 [Hibiscus syriacus]